MWTISIEWYRQLRVARSLRQVNHVPFNTVPDIMNPETWGTNEPAFESQHGTASGIVIVDIMLIVLHHCEFQHVKKFLDGSNPECQFLRCAIENLPKGHTTPDDTFSITEFDVVIHRNRMLGKGGFGEVFEGNWRGTRVAIKRIAYFHPAVSKAKYFFCWQCCLYLPSLVQTRSTFWNHLNTIISSKYSERIKIPFNHFWCAPWCLRGMWASFYSKTRVPIVVNW